jgi:hypothetical protein
MDRIHLPNKYDRTDLWREGKWLDLWSVVHFLSGMSVAFCFYFLHFGAFASTALALVCLIAYEMWEIIVKIEEMPTNRFMDVVTGMASFVPTFFIFAPRLTFDDLIEAFALVLALNILLSIIGWRVSKKAIELQKRMRLRYDAERNKLLKQKLHLQDKFKR